MPAKRRAAVGALWRLDAALGNALSGGREPLISQIKLAWWREALEKLDREKAPAEPALRAVAEHVLPLGVSGAELAEMEAPWALLLSPDPLSPEDLDSYARRGALLFDYTARLLGRSDDVAPAGERWALIDLARNCANAADANAAVAAAAARPGRAPWPSPLRPLGMLAVLDGRDLEPQRPHWEPHGSPGRMWRMLRHRFTGR